MMKKKLLIIGLILGFSIQLFSQTTQMQTQILEKCLDLKEIQQYYPLNNQNKKQVYVSGQSISHLSDQTLLFSDKEVVFVTWKEIRENKIEAYFIFRNIENGENSSKVICHYFYDNNYQNKTAKYLAIDISLNKVNSEWKINSSNVKKGNI